MVIAYDGDKTRKIFTEQTSLLVRSVIGYSRETNALVSLDRGKSNFGGHYEMSLADGTIKGPRCNARTPILNG